MRQHPRTDKILTQYRNTVAWDGAGPVDENDVETARRALDLGPGPWDQSESRRLVAELGRIARSRRPQFHVGYVDDRGAFHSREGELPIDGVARPAVVFDPAGGNDNEREALATFRALARAERDGWLVNTAARLRSAGDTADRAARRVGIGETTLHDQDRRLKGMGIDPVSLGDLGEE